MNLAQIEQEALALEERERANLAVFLLNTLAAVTTEISDNEVARRDMELESGKVAPVSHGEFIISIQQARRK